MENILDVSGLNCCLEIKGRQKMNKKKFGVQRSMMIRRNRKAYAVVGFNTTRVDRLILMRLYFESTRHYSAWHGSAQLSSARLGSARFDSVRFGSIRFGSTPSSVEISRQPAASVVAVTSRRVLCHCSSYNGRSNKIITRFIRQYLATFFFILHYHIIEVYVNSQIEKDSSEF